MREVVAEDGGEGRPGGPGNVHEDRERFLARGDLKRDAGCPLARLLLRPIGAPVHGLPEDPTSAEGFDSGECASFGALGSPESSDWKPLVAFVHIPRTGGGSVTSAISRAYGRAKSSGNVQKNADKSHRLFRRIAENPDAWSGRALADHVPYGLYARYLPPDTRYITFMRNPVERVLSHYHFHAQAGPEKVRTIWRREGAEVADEDDVSLESGLARGITIYNNFATRFLWGGDSLDGGLPPNALELAKE